MALLNNLRLFFLFCYLLIPLHLARPGISSSLYPESSPQSEPVPSPSSEPTSVSSPSPEAPIPSPSSGPRSVLAPGPASVPSPSLAPASVPTPFTGPDPGPSPVPSPSPGPASVPTPSIGPAPGPSPSSGPAPGPSPSLGQAPEQALGPSPSSGLAPGPSPSTLEYEGLFQIDFSPTLAPSIDVDSKVKEICDSTDHPSLCLATIVPLLDGKTDVSSVLNVAIRAGAKISRYGLFLAQKLAGDPENSPELASVLSDCKRSYNTAVDSYENTIDAFPEHDIGTMNSMLSAVITNVGDCEDALSKQRQDFPLSTIGVRLRNMTSNCLAIVSLLD